MNASQSNTSKLKITAGHDKSFKCDQDLDITLQGNVKVTVTIKKIQLQPFGGNDGADFGEGKSDCIPVIILQAFLYCIIVFVRAD